MYTPTKKVISSNLFLFLFSFLFGTKGIDDEDGKGETPLHDAAYNGHSEVALFLISSGANVSLQDRLGSMFFIFIFILILISTSSSLTIIFHRI